MAVTEAAIAYAEKLAAERKERRRAKSAKWKEDHKHGIKICKAIYRRANVEFERQRSLEYKKANPDKNRAYAAKDRALNPDKFRRRKRADKLKNKYDITDAGLELMFNTQGRVCSICERDEPVGNGYWHIDHVAGTRFVRGVLCNMCNPGLGLFCHNPKALREAARYLEDAAIRQAESYKPQNPGSDHSHGPGLQRAA